MRGMLLPVVLASLAISSAAYGAVAPRIAAGDELFTIGSIKVDATAQSPRAARDLAMAQGRPLAWSKLFRRVTAYGMWQKQPILTDEQLLRLILGAEPRNERRSTRRYLADVVFHFNPAVVRQLLRKSNIDYVESRAEPALVIPLTAGKDGFDPMSPWAIAWADPLLRQGVVPMLVWKDGTADLPMAENLGQLDWAALAPMALRYGASQVILAIASEDANTVQIIAVSAIERTAASFAFAQSTFAADVEAIVENAGDEWRQSADRERIAMDRALPAFTNNGIQKHLMATVRFETPEDLAAIRSRLSAVDAVGEVDVASMTQNEALIDLTYAGEADELRRALAKNYIELSDNGDEYWLDFGIAVAAISLSSAQ
jgi:hypothetical protein